jgi:dihydrofolate reductase
VVKKNFTKVIIAAIAQNGIIGKNGKLPWNSDEEMKHFQETTKGSVVLVGRVTFESFGKPLKKRMNVVISSKKKLADGYDNVVVYSDLDDAYNYLSEQDIDKVFICGGKNIYEEELNKADEMILSWMKFKAEGDTKFPEIDFDEWNITDKKDYNEFEVIYYKRKK